MIRHVNSGLGLFCIFALLAGTAFGQQQAKVEKKPAKRRPFEQVTDDPALPRVLLLGDSISIGYTLTVRDQLKGIANVHRPPENCQGTLHGVKKIDAWLGNGKWDVIHFNWGLHDLKFVDSKNRLSDPKTGKQQSELAVYKKNLEQLVLRLEKTGATLIFATTTPIPTGSAGRVVGDEEKYNAAAKAIMLEHKIAVNDLFVCVQALPDDCKLKANVHYTQAGSKRLGQEVAKVLKKALTQSK